MAALIYPIVSLFVVAIVLLAILSIVYRSLRNGISPMPSSFAVRRVVVGEMNRIGSGGSVIEAGSGWGTLAFHLTKACPSWQVKGIENSWIPLGVSQLVKRLRVHSNVTFNRGDIYTCAYHNADLVVCYLFPGAMRKLSPLLREQLKPGAYMISVCFVLPDWEPERVITCRDLYQTKVYVYRHM